MIEPSLFLIGRIYHCRFQLGNHPRQQRTTRIPVGNKAAALAEARRIVQDEELRAKGLEPAMTVANLAQEWLEVNEPPVRSQGHWKSMERWCRLHMGSLAQIPINQVTTHIVELARAEFRRTHKASSTLQWLTLLKVLGNWAIRRKMMDRLPWDVKQIKPKRIPRPILPNGKTAAWLQVVDEFDPQAGWAVRLMLGLGLREMEAMRAPWVWLNWEARTYTPGETKGGEAAPLEVPDWLMDFLEVRRGASTSPWMIPGEEGKPHAAGYCRRAMQAANFKCGTPGITPHRLRATCATRMAKKTTIRNVQVFMRHRKPETTLRYIEEDSEDIRRAQVEIAREQGIA